MNWNYKSLSHLSIVLLVGCMVPTIAIGQQTTCATAAFPDSTIRMDHFNVANNLGLGTGNDSETTGDCVTAYEGSAFNVGSSSYMWNPNVPSMFWYPIIWTGCHWGNCSNKSFLPKNVGVIMGDELTTGQGITISNTGSPGAQTFDATYDIWFNKTCLTSPCTSGPPDGLELMVKLQYGDMQAAGQPHGVYAYANIDNVNYTVYATNLGDPGHDPVQGQPQTLTFQVNPETTSKSINLGHLIQWAMNHNVYNADGTTLSNTPFLDSSEYLVSVEFGFEIINGGQNLATNWFWVQYCPYTSNPGAGCTMLT